MTQTSIRLKNGTFVVAFTNYVDRQDGAPQKFRGRARQQHSSPMLPVSSGTPPSGTPASPRMSPPVHARSSPHFFSRGSPKVGFSNGGFSNGGSPNGGSPNGGSPRGGSPKGGSPRGASPRQLKTPALSSPKIQRRISGAVSAGLSAAKSPPQNMRALLTKNKYKVAQLIQTAGYIVCPTGSGCTVTQLFSVDLKGTYMPRTVFRYVLPALQGVTPIKKYFQVKSFVPAGMIRFQDRLNSESLLGNMAVLCTRMLPEANFVMKSLQKKTDFGNEDDDDDDNDDDDDDEFGDGENNSEGDGNDKGDDIDEDGDSNKDAAKEREGHRKQQQQQLKQSATPPVQSNLENPELRPAEQLDLPPELLEEAPADSNSTRGSSTRGSSMRGGGYRKGSMATPSVRGTTNSKIIVSSDFAHLTKGVYNISHEKSHLLCKLDFECSAAELTSRIAYREGLGMQYKRKMKEVDSQGNVHWEDKQALFSQDSSSIMSDISVEYVQAISNISSGSFIIQRKTVGDRPVVIPWSNKQGLVGKMLPRSMKEVRSFARSRHVPKDDGEEGRTPERKESGELSAVKSSLSSRSGGVLSWRKKNVQLEVDRKMVAGTQQTILIVADGNKAKKCSVIFHGTFFPMESVSREFTKPSLRALTLEGIFKEMHELQQHYLSEVIGSMTKSVIRARNNIGKGSWKLGVDPYTNQDDEIFLDGFDRYNRAREDFMDAAWSEVEARMNVHNIKTWWQKKKRRKRLTEHVQEAGDIIGMGIAQALGSLRGSLGSFTLNNEGPGGRRGSGRASGRSDHRNELGLSTSAEFGAISTSGLTSMRRQKIDTPQDRLEHLKASKEKERNHHERSKGRRRSSATSYSEQNVSSWVINARKKSVVNVQFDSNLPSMRVVKDPEEELRRGDRATVDTTGGSSGKGKYPGFAQALKAMQANMHNHAIPGTETWKAERKTPERRRGRQQGGPNFYLKLNR